MVLKVTLVTPKNIDIELMAIEVFAAVSEGPAYVLQLQLGGHFILKSACMKQLIPRA